MRRECYGKNEYFLLSVIVPTEDKNGILAEGGRDYAGASVEEQKQRRAHPVL